jgi:hypothetical protein
MPHKWWQANYGAELRRIIADGKHLRGVVDFGDQQVFNGATTYTAIHVFQSDKNIQEIEYVKFNELIDGISQCNAIDTQPSKQIEGVIRRTTSANGNIFSFAPSLDYSQTGIKPLSAIAKLSQGFKTGADKVFVVEFVRQVDSIATIFSTESQSEHEVEAEALRVLLKSEHMKSYEIRPSILRLIYPYDRGTWKLLAPSSLETQFPLLWRYFLEMRSALKRRERGRFDGDLFYQYSRPQNFAPLSKPKIINPDICEHPQMCWDNDGDRVFSGGAAGGVAIVPHEGIDHFYLLGILNSEFAEYWIRTNGTPFRGGYLNCEIRFIRELPVKLPSTPAEKKLAARIADSVKAIMAAKTSLQNTMLSGHERSQLERTVETYEKRIDTDVFELYGVAGLPS